MVWCSGPERARAQLAVRGNCGGNARMHRAPGLRCEKMLEEPSDSESFAGQARSYCSARLGAGLLVFLLIT
ncbi:BQ5605_C007g04882 [Microbotryum silenes-dioicae]|uniref:BQ5605_C007g04882 protein n=1 Tax=Microbotryum silenes-dioicae TaxID=796604 RepID=A0A2X0PAL2_9BASI|nr:BQ5605_C007g04882 [Microbotryum silenes-dioicae]